MFQILCLPFAIGGMLLIAAEQAAVQKPPGFASPHEAWEAYRHARHEGQWRKAFQCLTPESQDRFLAVIVMSCSYSEAAGDKRMAEPLKEALKKHGLDPEEVEAGTEALSLDDYVKHLSSRVKDQEGLFHEAMSIVSRVIPQPKSKDGKRMIAKGPLTKVDIAGDRATGKFMKKLDDRTFSEVDGVRRTEIGQAVRFRKINSRWFCDLRSGY